MTTETLLRTPLYEAHVEAGGRMVPFAGYEMPVQYTSVIAESKAVRSRAGVFDVSHMARLSFEGERVIEFLDWVTANDISKLSDGVGQYSLLTNEHGGVVDDIIVYRLTESRFSMVVNASNHAKDVAWLREQNRHGVQIEDHTEQTAMLALQGPSVEDLLGLGSAWERELRAAPTFGVVECEVSRVPVTAHRSGYTGEDGFELVCRAEDARQLWNVLMRAQVTPCGLASRDALRVEAGLPLYGHELSDDINPIAAGLGWVISKTKAFIGSEPINRARVEGTPRKLQGVRLDSKRLLSPGMSVNVEGKPVGEVTSGVFSPLLDTSIAFAFVDSEIPLNTPCEVDVRGKMEPGTLVNKRFFKRSK